MAACKAHGLDGAGPLKTGFRRRANAASYRRKVTMARWLFWGWRVAQVLAFAAALGGGAGIHWGLFGLF